MKCEELEVFISAYIDGEVSDDERRVVEEHLVSCRDCGEMLSDFTQIHSLYGDLDELQAPKGFREGVTQRIERSSARSLVVSWKRFGVRAALSLALLLLLVGTAVFWTVRESGMQQTEETLLAGDIDVFAEEILFGDGLLDETGAFSGEDGAVADDVLNEFFLGEADTSGLMEIAEFTT